MLRLGVWQSSYHPSSHQGSCSWQWAVWQHCPPELKGWVSETSSPLSSGCLEYACESPLLKCHYAYNTTT